MYILISYKEQKPLGKELEFFLKLRPHLLPLKVLLTLTLSVFMCRGLNFWGRKHQPGTKNCKEKAHGRTARPALPPRGYVSWKRTELQMLLCNIREGLLALTSGILARASGRIYAKLFWQQCKPRDYCCANLGIIAVPTSGLLLPSACPEEPLGWLLLPPPDSFVMLESSCIGHQYNVMQSVNLIQDSTPHNTCLVFRSIGP